MAATKRITISEKFHLCRVPQDPRQLGDTIRNNEDYFLSAEDLIDTDHDSERVYEKIFAASRVELVGEGFPGIKVPLVLHASEESDKKAAGKNESEENKPSENDADVKDVLEKKIQEDPEKKETQDQESGEKAAAKESEKEDSQDRSSEEDETEETGAENIMCVEDASGEDGSQEYRPEVMNLSDGIWVVADGVIIGRIRDADRLHLQNIFQNYKISGLELDVHGGRYRIIVADEENEPEEKKAQSRWSALLTVYYRVPRNASEITADLVSQEQVAAMVAALTEKTMNQSGPGRAYANASQTQRTASAAAPRQSGPEDQSAAADQEGEPGEEKWGIDTTYETVRKEKDPSGRGLVFLLIAAVYATFYLCFSVPGWIPSMAAGTSSIKIFGYAVTGLPGYVPGGIMIAGLVFNIIAMFSGGGVIPVVAALLYLLAGFVAPKCVLFTSIAAVFCILGALRKKKGNAALRYILALAAAAAAAFLLYQYFAGTVIFSPFQGNDLTDWTSVVNYARGERAVVVEDTDEADLEHTGLSDDGTIYYADESEFESDWWEDESDWFYGDDDWLEEDETEFMYWDDFEMETDVNGAFSSAGEFGGTLMSGLLGQTEAEEQSGIISQSGDFRPFADLGQIGELGQVGSNGQIGEMGQSGEAGLL